MFFEPGQHKQNGLPHDPFKALISPRPIGWISSVSADGRHNLAPYSFFNAMSYKPPIVAFGAGNRPGGGKKDSILNIEETGEFVHNVVGFAQTEDMNETAIHIPHGETKNVEVHTSPLRGKLIGGSCTNLVPGHFGRTDCLMWAMVSSISLQVNDI